MDFNSKLPKKGVTLNLSVKKLSTTHDLRFNSKIMRNLFTPSRSSTLRTDKLSSPFPIGTVTNNYIWKFEEDEAEDSYGDYNSWD